MEPRFLGRQARNLFTILTVIFARRITRSFLSYNRNLQHL